MWMRLQHRKQTRCSFLTYFPLRGQPSRHDECYSDEQFTWHYIATYPSCTHIIFMVFCYLWRFFNCFFPVVQQPTSFLKFLYHTQLDTHAQASKHAHAHAHMHGRKFLNNENPLPTHTKKEPNIHALSRTGTHYPGNREPADLGLRPKGHRDWLFFWMPTSVC